MNIAVHRPSTLSRIFVAGMAALVLLVHGVLEPAHLLSHHGGAEEHEHHAAHQGGHDHHGDNRGHSDEHDGGDHAGTGHLLEVVPHPSPVSALLFAVADSSRPGVDRSVVYRECGRVTPEAEQALNRPPVRGPVPPRAPPIG